jgi:hypothetical protein
MQTFHVILVLAGVFGTLMVGAFVVLVLNIFKPKLVDAASAKVKEEYLELKDKVDGDNE